MGQALKSETSASAFDAAEMIARVMTFAPATDAEALKLLRASFPQCSLSMRIAALDYLMRRKPRGFGQSYKPR
jgi:hypothetical protein